MDEAVGVVTQPADPWRSYPSGPPGKAEHSRGMGRTRRRWVTGLTILVILGLVTIAWLTFYSGEPYEFLEKQADGKTPVAYSPCRPIRYVIRRQGEPPGGAEIIQEAVARVSQATGLQFVYDGQTSEGFSRKRRAHQISRYGNRWAPVLITWVTREEDPDLDATSLGAGGSTPIQVPNGQRAYVTGAIELDAKKLADMLPGLNGRTMVRTVVMHELGHVVGLDHVRMKNQVMYPGIRPGVSEFGAGDLAGLAALGKGTCSSQL